MLKRAKSLSCRSVYHHPRLPNVFFFAQGYGILEEISLKQGFGFVEFEDSRDADDAISDLDGRTICGRRVQIELATGDRNARRDADRYST